MNWPQTVFVVLLTLNLAFALFMHGQTYKKNFWVVLVDSIFTYWLVWSGGFFE